MSRPVVEIANEAVLIFPAKLKPNVMANPVYRGVFGLYGVTQFVNGRSTASAVCREDGTASGKAEMNGDRREGVAWCSDLSVLASVEPRHRRPRTTSP